MCSKIREHVQAGCGKVMSEWCRIINCWVFQADSNRRTFPVSFELFVSNFLQKILEKNIFYHPNLPCAPFGPSPAMTFFFNVEIQLLSVVTWSIVGFKSYFYDFLFLCLTPKHCVTIPPVLCPSASKLGVIVTSDSSEMKLLLSHNHNCIFELF